MKKILLIAAIAIATTSLSNAQEIGVRFGDVSGGNVALDGVFGLGQFSRIHADASFGDGFGLDVLWDFLYRPLGGESFNWYAGVGPYFVFDDPFQFGAIGEVGLEYRFNNLPISISGDWRPTFRFVEDTDFFADKFGFNVRYIFGGS